MLDAYDLSGNLGNLVVVPTRITGAGAANPVKDAGIGVTVTYVSTGKYRYTFSEYMGDLIGITFGCGHTGPTAANARVASLDTDSYTSTSLAADVFFLDTATPTLQDLTSSDSAQVVFWFKRGGGPKVLP